MKNYKNEIENKNNEYKIFIMMNINFHIFDKDI